MEFCSLFRGIQSAYRKLKTLKTSASCTPPPHASKTARNTLAFANHPARLDVSENCLRQQI